MRQEWWNWLMPMAVAGVCLYLIYLMFTHPSQTEMDISEMDVTGLRVE